MTQQSLVATERDLCRIRRAMKAHDDRSRVARKRAWGDGYERFTPLRELERRRAYRRGRHNLHFLPWLNIDAIVADRSAANSVDAVPE